MAKTTQQQVFQRWNTIPEKLREALVSPQNTDILWKICRDQHLSDEKIYNVATIAGDVIFGFLHAEDLTKEIRTELNIAPEIANSIAQEIDRKIFGPIRNEIEKVYSPVPEISEIKPIIKPKPEEIKPATQTPPPASLPVVIEAPAAPKPETEVKPFILHQENQPKPLGGNWFRKPQPTNEMQKAKPTETPVKVEIQVPGSEELLGIISPKEKKPVVAKTESPKQKIVHYREVPAPAAPFGKIPEAPKPFDTAQGKPPEPLKPAPEPPKPIPKPPEPVKPPEPLKPAPEIPKSPEAGPKIINLEDFEK